LLGGLWHLHCNSPQEQKFFCFAAGQAFFSKKEALAFLFGGRA
jgi:hypothetical protein